MVANERLTAFLIVIGAICLTVTGELFLKTGMNRVGTVHLSEITNAIARVTRTPHIYVGFAFVFSGSLLWLTALSRAPLSFAYPILSLGYILVLVSSKVILHEPVSLLRWIGTAVVICGVWLVFQSWK